MAQLVKCMALSQVMISQFMSSSPASGSVLTAQSREPASDSVSFSLTLPLSHLCSLSHSLSLSLKNKQQKKLVFFLIEKITHLGLLDGALGLGSGHDLMVCEFEPHVRLCADSSEPGACFRFCVSLSLPLPGSCSVSLSQK